MLYLLSLFIRALAGFLPLLLMMALFYAFMMAKDKKINQKAAFPHMAASCVFCFFITLVLSITDIPHLYDLSMTPTVNFIPFADIGINFHQYVLNALLFVPIGFLPPMLWRKFQKRHVPFLWGFFFSLSVELIQLFNSRITDIDDLLMNTLGTIIGYYLFVLIKRRFPGVSVLAPDRADHWKWEPYACFCFAWVSMFFIQPLVTGWLQGLAVNPLDRFLIR